MMAISTTPISQVGIAIHFSIIAAPAIASTGTTMTQKVKPADREPGPVPEPDARELGERADVRHLDGHLAQHPHDQQHQEAGDRVSDEYRGPCRGDRRAAADEQARPDDAANRDHRDVARA
jgi:hypothetical protein